MSSSTSATISGYFQSIQFRGAPSSELDTYSNLVNQGVMTLAQVREAIIDDPYTTNNVDPVVRLYQAAFGRVPESASAIDFYADRLADGRINLTTIAENFANSPEFSARYSSTATSAPNGAYITALYLNVLDRAPSALELSWYLNSGMSTAVMLRNFSQSPEFQARSGDAVEALLNANALGTAVFSGPLQITVPGQTFVLTTGQDDRAGTAGNDTFTATNLTLNAGDVVIGGAGTDVLNVFVSGSSNATLAPAQVAGVENVHVNNVAATGLVAGSAEVATVTVGALQAGQFMTVAGTTLHATADLTAAQVATALNGVSVTGATLSGSLSGWTRAAGPNSDQVRYTAEGVGNKADLVLGGNALSNAPQVNVLTVSTSGSGGAVDNNEHYTFTINGTSVTTASVGASSPTTATSATAIANAINAFAGQNVATAAGATVQVVSNSPLSIGSFTDSASTTATSVANALAPSVQTLTVGGTPIVAGQSISFTVNGATVNTGLLSGTQSAATNATAIANAINAHYGTTIATTNSAVVTVNSGDIGLAIGHFVASSGTSAVSQASTVTSQGLFSTARPSISVIDGVADKAAATYAATVDASKFVGATEFASDRSMGAVTFDNLAAGQSLAKLAGDAALTGNYASTVTTGTLNISGGSTAGAVTIGGSGLTTLNVNSTGAANTVGGIAATAATTVNINATTNLVTGLVDTAASAKINVSGSAESVKLGTLDTQVTTVNASGLTAGGVTLELSGTDQKVTGGAGHDVITVGSHVLSTTGFVNGGAGTDRVIISAATALTKDTAARITNVETLQVGGTSQTYDFSLISGLSDLRIDSGTSLVVNKLGATTPVTVLASQQTELTLNLANATGAADAMTVTLQNQDHSLAVGKLSIAGVETLNLVSSATKGTNANTLSSLEGNGDLARVTISGAQALSLTTGTLAQSLTIDGSAATGNLTVVASGVGGIATITTGSGKDTVTGSAHADAINTGEGVDTINIGAGADVVNAGGGDDVFVTANGGFTATAALVLDGGAGTDVIKIGTDASSGSGFLGVDFDEAGVNLLNIEGITFTGTGSSASSVMFSGAQLSGRSMAITGSESVNTLTVNAALGSSVDLSGLTFTTWTNGAGSGNDVLNLVGSTGGETLRGSVKNDVITGGEGRDTIDLSDGGADTVVMTGIVAAANRDVITGFTVGTGTGADTVRLADAATTKSHTGASFIEVVALAPSAALTFGTDNADILEFSFNLAGDGGTNDLDNFTNGTGLLNSLGQNLLVKSDGNDGFVIAYQGGNAYLYHIDEGTDSDSGAVQAAEIALIGVFNNIAVGGFVSQNFSMA